MITVFLSVHSHTGTPRHRLVRPPLNVHYVKWLCSNNSGIASLKKDSIVYSDSKSKAEILNEYFSSVFTEEHDIPETNLLGAAAYPDIPPITVHEAGVQKLLSRHKVHKASRPDQTYQCSQQRRLRWQRTIWIFMQAYYADP